MQTPENGNAPWPGKWALGAAAGLVVFGVLVGVGTLGLFPAAAIGVVVALIVAFILGMPFWVDGDQSAPEQSAVPKDADLQVAVAKAPPPASPAKAAPVAFVAAPAPKAAAPGKKPAKPKAAARKAPATPKAAAEKAPATPKAVKAKPAGPERLTAPRNGKADDLKEIEGIGPAMEKLLNGMGFYHFDQIAAWSATDVTMVDAEMKTFRGRISRDKWVSQARIITSEGLEAFRLRARTNDY